MFPASAGFAMVTQAATAGPTVPERCPSRRVCKPFFFGRLPRLSLVVSDANSCLPPHNELRIENETPGEVNWWRRRTMSDEQRPQIVSGLRIRGEITSVFLKILIVKYYLLPLSS